MTHNLCDECETVNHCRQHGCIPKASFGPRIKPQPGLALESGEFVPAEQLSPPAAAQEQPAQREPVFCEHCGGNDEDPQDHCMDCTRPRWEPVTQELLNNQHPWLYEPMWIATKSGRVIQGHYEWRQGRNPDRFITDDGDDWAFDASHVMPMVKPTHPDKEQP